MTNDDTPKDDSPDGGKSLSEIDNGLKALIEEVNTARHTIERGETPELGPVSDRVDMLCQAAIALPGEEAKSLQPVMETLRGELRALSDAMNAVMQAAEKQRAEEENGSENGTDPSGDAS